MKFTHGVLLAVALVLCLCLAAPVSAWGKSMNVAVTDSYPYDLSGTCSDEMGCWYVTDSNYQAAGRSFTSLDSSGVNAASLAGKDTLVFFSKDPGDLSASDKADINAWINAGGKLIIWDSEDAADSGGWDYTWLPFAFSSAGPGAQGASGYPLWIEEENQLSTFAAGPYHIDNLSLSQNTDAVGDSSIFTARNPAQWCVDMRAQNALQLTGPVQVYSKPIGSGIIIYNGLDFDYANTDLKNLIGNALNADNLPCSVSWSGNILVTKVADKAVYTKGDTITFTVTVQNPQQNPSGVYDAVMTDTPPAEITLIDPASYNLGTIAPGATITKTITATADSCGTNLINNGAVVGNNAAGTPQYSGGQNAVFSITGCGTNAPEFPTLALPVGMILGLAFVVYSLKPVRKN